MDTTLQFPEKLGLIYSTELFWNGPTSYETSTSQVIAILVSKSNLFLDIGSNIGIYAVYAAIKYPSTTVFAFEPIPAIWEKNIAFHRCNNLPEQNILNLAISDRDGYQKIFLPVCSGGLEEEQTATLCTDSWQTREKKVETMEIKCSTLDSFAKKISLPTGFCTLKIDVENFEAAVLQGAKIFIAAHRPWIVCEILPNQEFDSETKSMRNNNQAVLNLIVELGYVPFAITNEGLFRMTIRDFSEPRKIKDFLLFPTEKVLGDTFYLSYSSLEQILTI